MPVEPAPETLPGLRRADHTAATEARKTGHGARPDLAGVMTFANSFSLNVDPITNHPDFELLKFPFPALLERLHPSAVFLPVRHINDNPSEIVAVDDARLLPAPFDGLCFVTDGAETIADFQDCQ